MMLFSINRKFDLWIRSPSLYSRPVHALRDSKLVSQSGVGGTLDSFKEEYVSSSEYPRFFFKAGGLLEEIR